MSDTLLLRPGLALCPTGKVLRNPWVHIEGEGIRQVGEGKLPVPLQETDVVSAPDLVLTPGLVNAHAHLALTALAGALEPTSDFWGWIIELITARRALTDEQLQNGLAEGIRLSLEAGTTTVLDFFHLYLAPETPVRHMPAPELFAFTPEQTAAVADEWMSLGTPLAAPHAVYSTTPELLEIVADQARRRGGLLTIHLSETMDENREWLVGHTDNLGRYYRFLGIDRRDWQSPRCSPTQYLARLPAVLGRHTLLVHCNYLSDGDIEIIAGSGAHVCFCPATHRFFNHPPHPLPKLLKAGVPVCLGSDALVSSPSLSMWDQVRIVAEDHPDLPWTTLLQMITTTGARALGFGKAMSTLAPNAPADFVLVKPQSTLEEIATDPRRLFQEETSVQSVYVRGRQAWSR